MERHQWCTHALRTGRHGQGPVIDEVDRQVRALQQRLRGGGWIKITCCRVSLHSSEGVEGEEDLAVGRANNSPLYAR